jgi:hypothetical protein
MTWVTVVTRHVIPIQPTAVLLRRAVNTVPLVSSVSTLDSEILMRRNVKLITWNGLVMEDVTRREGIILLNVGGTAVTAVKRHATHTIPFTPAV